MSTNAAVTTTSRRRTEAPPIFAWLAILYVLFLGVMALGRSLGRHSMFAGFGRNIPVEGEASSKSERPAEDASRLRLQDFRRIEVRHGKTAWDITADSATYFESEKTTLLRSPVMIVYRGDGTTMRISAQAAQLIATGAIVDKARLEGQVVVINDDQTKIQTDLAVFEADRNVIEIPGLVKISGTGYEVIGKRMTLTMEKDTIQLGETVRTRFMSGAKPPSKVSTSKPKER